MSGIFRSRIFRSRIFRIKQMNKIVKAVDSILELRCRTKTFLRSNAPGYFYLLF